MEPTGTLSRFASQRYGIFNQGGDLVAAPIPDDLRSPQGAFVEGPAGSPDGSQGIEPAQYPDMDPAAVRERRASHRRDRGTRAWEYFQRMIERGDAIDAGDFAEAGDGDGSGIFSRFGATPRDEQHRLQAYQALAQGRDPYGPHVPVESKMPRGIREHTRKVSREDWHGDVMDELAGQTSDGEVGER